MSNSVVILPMLIVPRPFCLSKTRKGKQVRREIRNLTANDALWLLKCNQRNRTVSQQTVKKYRDLMLAGKWNPEADTPIKIGVGPESWVLDGQHRLLALAGMSHTFSLSMEIWFDCDPKSQQYMDRGRKRNLGQDLGIHKVSNSTTKAAALGPVFYYLINGKVISQCPQPGTEDTMEFMESYPPFDDIIKNTSSMIKKRNSLGWTPAQCGALATLFSLATDYDTAMSFVERVATGLGISGATDPAYVLKNLLELSKSNKKSMLALDHIYHMSIKAWNKSIRGESVQILRADNEFPKVLSRVGVFDPRDWRVAEKVITV